MEAHVYNRHVRYMYREEVRIMGSNSDSTTYYLCDPDTSLYLRLLTYKMGIIASLIS